MCKKYDDTVAIILAAGEGTRMKSKRAKILHPLLGKPMLEYIIESLRLAGIPRMCVVIGSQSDAVKRAFRDTGIDFVFQSERLGTGHAVLQAGPYLESAGTVLVTCGDVPLVKIDTYRNLLDTHLHLSPSATLLTAVVPDPAGYGRVVRNRENRPDRIVGGRDCDAGEKEIGEVNSGIYCFR
jgi:bifunctional UDP-N-acetylglucosamine pyrophosphorylase/glucosamine-1-phosphate N-acetyltransferase